MEITSKINEKLEQRRSNKDIIINLQKLLENNALEIKTLKEELRVTKTELEEKINRVEELESILLK